jgi:hypothetical protein
MRACPTLQFSNSCCTRCNSWACEALFLMLCKGYKYDHIIHLIDEILGNNWQNQSKIQNHRCSSSIYCETRGPSTQSASPSYLSQTKAQGRRAEDRYRVKVCYHLVNMDKRFFRGLLPFIYRCSRFLSWTSSEPSRLPILLPNIVRGIGWVLGPPSADYAT